MQVYINILIQMCEGLQEIHKGHQYHMDFKPGNILLKGNNVDSLSIKIGDFGTVKDFQADYDQFALSLTSKTTGYRGTPRYMKPSTSIT